MLMMSLDPDTELAAVIVRIAGDAIIAVDRDGVIMLWNPAAERIFGYSASEAVGQTLDLIVPEPLRDRHWHGFNEVMKTGVTKYATSVLPAPALTRCSGMISVEFTIGVLRAGDKVSGAVAVLRDVTAREREDRALRRRVRELERAPGA